MESAEFTQSIIDNSNFLKPVAAALTSDKDAAQDLIQDTLYLALKNKDKFDGSNLRGWLSTIMRNHFINGYRRKSVRKEITSTSEINELLLNHNQFSVDNPAEVNLNFKSLLAILDTLPAKLKKAFTMYFEGYKYDEIAEAMQEPVGTTKSRIHFARKILNTKVTRY